MDKGFLKEFEKKLKKGSVLIEKILKKSAKKDVKPKSDWDTRFPDFGKTESGGGISEKLADEVEEYGNLLAIEFNLETRLKDINSALDKIKKGKYGICEKCGKEISLKRLDIIPEAKTCLSCRK